MACVTLKRPIEVLGSPHLSEHQPLAKRKRCGPPLFPTTPSSPRGVKRAKRKLDVDDHYSSPVSSNTTSSPFLSATPPINSGEEPTSIAKVFVVRVWWMFSQCVVAWTHPFLNVSFVATISA